MVNQSPIQDPTSLPFELPPLSGPYRPNRKPTPKQETLPLLEPLSLQNPTASSAEQVRLLEAIHNQLAAQSTTLQFVWNAILQTVVVCIAFLFGLFSIFSWHGQWDANQIARKANQIALISLCLSNNSTIEACVDVVGKADAALGYLLRGAINDVYTAGYEDWPWSVGRSYDPTILIVYTVVPVLAGGTGIYASWKIYHERGRRLGKSNL